MNTAILKQLPQKLEGTHRLVYGLIAAWVVSMISLPIFLWTIGESAIVWGVYVTTALQALAAVVALSTRWPWTRVAYVVGIVVTVTLGAEALGTATGFPFGRYNYTDLLQPQVLHVPIIITVAWLMMLPSSWAVAAVITGANSGWRFIAVSAAAMTAWDLFLDPQMVDWGLWVWEDVGSFTYFGIPWQNYFGWLLVSGIVTALARPTQLPTNPLLLIYVTVWVLQTIGMLFFWGLVGPAIVGFIGMGLFVTLVARHYLRDNA